MATVKATFLFDEKLFKAFKDKCKREGRTMTWYLTRWMKETTGQLTLDDALAAAEDRAKGKRSKRAARAR